MSWICRVDALADGQIRSLNEDAVLVRTKGCVRAFQRRCPHAGADLAEGAVVNDRLVCPWHKAAFNLDDGGLVEPPALDGLAAFDVDVQGGLVRVSSSPRPRAPRKRSRSSRSVHVLGSGAAAVAACAALRDGGFSGKIMMIGEEAGAPYDRTSLSKFVIAGEMDPDAVPPLREESFWSDFEIERLATRITRVDAAAARIELADGAKIGYDQAIVALGAKALRPAFARGHEPNTYVLRDRADAAAVLAAARPGSKALIVGGGFIALEAASAFRKRGVSVAIASLTETPFLKQFGRSFGALFKTLHESNGVAFHTPAEPVSIEKNGEGVRVALRGGNELFADFVLIATGVEPATQAVEGVAKTEDGAILVDACMRAGTGLFAVGDCASFPWRGRPTRIEHWRTAQQQARVAAANSLGRPTRYEGPPFFWTYHYGKRFDYLRHAVDWDDVQVLGDPSALSFMCFFIKSGFVDAVLACQRERQIAYLAERLRTPLPVAEALALG